MCWQPVPRWPFSGVQHHKDGCDTVEVVGDEQRGLASVAGGNLCIVCIGVRGAAADCISTATLMGRTSGAVADQPCFWVSTEDMQPIGRAARSGVQAQSAALGLVEGEQASAAPLPTMNSVSNQRPSKSTSAASSFAPKITSPR